MKFVSTLLTISTLSVFVAASCSSSSATGPNGTRLTLLQPANQWMSQGASNQVNVIVDRDGFSDPVKVTFSNLPSGVRVDENTIPSGDSSKTFVLVAAANAAVVEDQVVTVTAEASGIRTSQTFELTVKPKA